MKIIVLGGGNSPERDVSLRSASAVAAGARSAGFDVEELDPADGLVFLTGMSNDSLIFPILHGAGGEDGSLQSEMESHNVKFLGSGSEASKNAFDKGLTREIITSAGIIMPRGDVVTSDTYLSHQLYNQPHVLKVCRGGSSIGTCIVREPGQFDMKAIDELFELDNTAVIEELIIGKEVTVPILDRKALPIIEIVPPQGLEFDYENKYNGRTAEICPATSIDSALQAEISTIAERAHSILGCRHLSRVDFMIDETGKPYFLELNTMPGLTDQSLYPKSAVVAGLQMPDLVKKFVELVSSTL